MIDQGRLEKVTLVRGYQPILAKLTTCITDFYVQVSPAHGIDSFYPPPVRRTVFPPKDSILS